MGRAKRNLYEILGVGERADLKTIKAAYRAAAKRLHPALSLQTDERFKDLQEAYETLSDPVKREAYDLEVKLPPPPIHEYGTLSGEPLFGSFDPMDRLFSTLDSLWRYSRPDRLRLARQRPAPLRLEIILTSEEAHVGGELSLDVPVVVVCNRCLGSGEKRGLICGQCRVEGQERLTKRTSLIIPPGVRNRTRKRFQLDIADVGRVDLFVTVRVWRY